jgi:hypothetical protein
MSSSVGIEYQFLLMEIVRHSRSRGGEKLVGKREGEKGDGDIMVVVEGSKGLQYS